MVRPVLTSLGEGQSYCKQQCREGAGADDAGNPKINMEAVIMSPPCSTVRAMQSVAKDTARSVKAEPGQGHLN